MRCCRAIELMYRLGGYQTGKTFRIDRGQLIAELDRVAARPDYTFEFRHTRHLAESIEQNWSDTRPPSGLQFPVPRWHHWTLPCPRMKSWSNHIPAWSFPGPFPAAGWPDFLDYQIGEMGKYGPFERAVAIIGGGRQLIHVVPSWKESMESRDERYGREAITLARCWIKTKYIMDVPS